MRIACPHCGLRDVREFTYLGDAAPERPNPQAPDAVEMALAKALQRATDDATIAAIVAELAARRARR